MFIQPNIRSAPNVRWQGPDRPVAPARKRARRRAGRLARTLRTRQWPRFMLARVLLVVVGATLLSG